MRWRSTLVLGACAALAVALGLIVFRGAPRRAGHPLAARAQPASVVMAARAVAPSGTCFVDGDGSCGETACSEFISDDVSGSRELVLGSRCRDVRPRLRVLVPRHAVTPR